MSRGKHRKPTSTDKRAVAFGIAGGIAAASVPALAGAPSASAADSNVWDRIAQCESTGDWSIDTGNGYSGGLQFSPSTWRAFGGAEFASRASGATRTEQIFVATRVQQAQGWGAWPVCSRVAGATGSPPARATPSPGDAPRPRSTDPATPPDSSSGSSSGGSGAGEQKTPIPAPTTTDASAYTVVAGDTLSAISREHFTGESVTELAVSSGVSDPNLIMPGQRIVSQANAPASSDATADAPETPSVTESGSHRAGDDAIGAARTYIGVPYSYGGTTRAGLDCSALVQNAFARTGVDLPRTADGQYRATERISRSELRPGDLVFRVTGGRAGHVGIYIGGGMQIDAPRTGKTVGVHPLYSSQNAYGRVTA